MDMHTRTLRNALIALTALSFSITATSCGRIARLERDRLEAAQARIEAEAARLANKIILGDV